jgi:alpha-galactosidase
MKTASTLAAIAAAFAAVPSPAAEPAPIRVFILAGQSNMEGHGHIRTLERLGDNPEHAGMLKALKKDGGGWVERDDVQVWFARGRGPAMKGPLTVGFGVSKDNIGPELMFGHVMGNRFDEPVLLIKTAWGGRSLAIDFRSPSAGRPAKVPTRKDGKDPVGAAYADMLREARDVLGDLKSRFPAFEGRGHRVAGFVWFQGWNDMINAEYTAEYSDNLTHFIRDLRKDFGVPDLPVVIAEMGVGGKNPGANVERFRKAQQSAAARPEFRGNVALVNTARFWDEEAQALLDEGWKNRKWITKELEEKFNRMGSQPPYHYLGSASMHCLMGRALGEAMQELTMRR